MIIEKDIDGDNCVKCETKEDFVEWCKDCGFRDEIEFEEYTGCDFEDIEGEFFILIHNIVFFVNEKKLWIEEYKEGVS